VLLISCFPHSILVYIIQYPLGVVNFQSHIFIPKMILCCVFVGCTLWITIFTLKCLTSSGKVPSLFRGEVGLKVAELTSLWKSRPAYPHGKGITPMEPFHRTAALWEYRSMLGSIWEALIITLQSLNNRNPKPFFWRYVDTDCRIVPTELSPSLESWPPCSSVSPDKYWLYGLDVWSWYIWMGPASKPPQAFCYMLKKTLA